MLSSEAPAGPGSPALRVFACILSSAAEEQPSKAGRRFGSEPYNAGTRDLNRRESDHPARRVAASSPAVPGPEARGIPISWSPRRTGPVNGERMPLRVTAARDAVTAQSVGDSRCPSSPDTTCPRSCRMDVLEHGILSSLGNTALPAAADLPRHLTGWVASFDRRQPSNDPWRHESPHGSGYLMGRLKELKDPLPERSYRIIPRDMGAEPGPPPVPFPFAS